MLRPYEVQYCSYLFSLEAVPAQGYIMPLAHNDRWPHHLRLQICIFNFGERAAMAPLSFGALGQGLPNHSLKPALFGGRN